LGEGIGPLGFQPGGGFLLGKASDIQAAVHAHSRATRTEQRAWRTTRAALVPSRYAQLVEADIGKHVWAERYDAISPTSSRCKTRLLRSSLSRLPRPLPMLSSNADAQAARKSRRLGCLSARAVAYEHCEEEIARRLWQSQKPELPEWPQGQSRSCKPPHCSGSERGEGIALSVSKGRPRPTRAADFLHATACGRHQIRASSYFVEAASVIKEPRFHSPGRRRSCHLSHSGGFLSVVGGR